MLKINEKDKKKEMRAWFRGLSPLERAKAMQPYYPKYDITDMPLILLFKNMDIKKKSEMYEKGRNEK
jgi:hypothetical protein